MPIKESDAKIQAVRYDIFDNINSLIDKHEWDISDRIKLNTLLNEAHAHGNRITLFTTSEISAFTASIKDNPDQITKEELRKLSSIYLRECCADQAIARELGLYIWKEREMALWPEDASPQYRGHHKYLIDKAIDAIVENVKSENKTLDLSDLYLLSLPEKIGCLHHLEELLLENNDLYELPASIGRLIHLKILNCKENQLEVVPESVGHLSQLEMLDIAENNLKTLPESLRKLMSLRVLDVRSNLIENIDFIEDFSNLEILDCGYNPISNFPSPARDFSKLTYLNIYKTLIKDLPDDISKLDNLEIYFSSLNPSAFVDKILLNFNATLDMEKELAVRWSIQGKVQDTEYSYDGSTSLAQTTFLKDSLTEFIDEHPFFQELDESRVETLKEQLNKYAKNSYQSSLDAKLLCNDLKAGKPVIMTGDWSGRTAHSASLILYPKGDNLYLIKCNRGDRQPEEEVLNHSVLERLKRKIFNDSNKPTNGAIQIFLVDPAKFDIENPKTIKSLLTNLERERKSYFGKGMNREFNLKKTHTFSLKDQKTGNCSWASPKTVAFALLLMENAELFDDVTITFPPEMLKKTKEIYKEFSAFTRYKSLKKYLEEKPQGEWDKNLLSAIETRALLKIYSTNSYVIEMNPLTNAAQKKYLELSLNLLAEHALANPDKEKPIAHLRKNLDHLFAWHLLCSLIRYVDDDDEFSFPDKLYQTLMSADIISIDKVNQIVNAAKEKTLDIDTINKILSKNTSPEELE